MARQARIDAPGALHHITVRGIEHRKILPQDTNRDDFLKRLRGILCDSQTRCFAWALISKHLHLLLRTGLVPISNHTAASDGMRGEVIADGAALKLR
jgi:putative transposase